jgi:hypothetical protein
MTRDPRDQSRDHGDELIFIPWSRAAPWLIMLAGVCLGHIIGFSPWLFVAIGVLCLLQGLLSSS